jgi:hypothetical protein
MIYEKRGKWCFRDENGKLHKFDSEIAAKIALGSAPQTEIEDEEGAILQHQQEEESRDEPFEEEVYD